MEPRGFDPDNPNRKPELRQPDRPHRPPAPEHVTDDNGALIARDPRSAVDRTAATVTAEMDDSLLADALEADLLPADLVPTEEESAAAKPRKLSKKQRAALKLTQEALSLRASGYSVPEVAEHLGVSASTVTGWFTRHRRAVTADTLDQQLDQIAVPLAAENLIHGLLAGDKDYTLKTLEGRGAFKRHTDKGDEGGSGEPPPLIIRIEHPQSVQIGDGTTPPAQLPPGATGRIVSTPATVRRQEPKQITGAVITDDAEPTDV